MFPPQFTPEEVNRIVNAVREVEQLVRSAPANTYPAHGWGGPKPVVVQVIGAKITDTSPPALTILNPYEGESPLPEDGFYPGRIMFRNEESLSDIEDWYSDYDAVDDPYGGYCLIEEPNGEDLTLDRRYIGHVIGVRNGTPVIEVTKGEGGTGSSVQDLHGPEHAITNTVAVFTHPSGRFIGTANGVTYLNNQFSTGLIIGTKITAPPGAVAVPDYTRGITTYNQTLQILSDFATLDYDQLSQWSVLGNAPDVSATLNVHYQSDYFYQGELVHSEEGYRFNDNAANGFIYTAVNGTIVVRYHSSTNTNGFQYWMKHYSADGTAGVTGTINVKDHSGNNQTITVKDGIITGFTT